jgi:NAD(P)H dehydrogenase (quinone)
MKILILYYSMYGNNFRMAQAIAEGVKDEGGEPMVRTVPELIPAEVIEKDERLKKAKEIQKDVSLATQDDLIACDGLILGSPTRFGNMCAQMRNFWDRTTQIWLKGQLIGKPRDHAHLDDVYPHSPRNDYYGCSLLCRRADHH